MHRISNTESDAGSVFSDISYEVKDHAAWITIRRPEVRNAFTENTLDELAKALDDIKTHPSIAVVVIRGEGDKAFSAGGDFGAMMQLNRVNAHMWNDRMLKVAMSIRGLPVPVIAMVHGACVGGGHELALWCDLVISADDGFFGQTGAKVGACPTVGATQYLPRIIGERRAREMIFACRIYTAAEAERIGLINRVVPKAELQEATEEWCRSMVGFSGQTHRATKKSLNFESDQLYASWQHGMELLAEIWGTPEAMEGMQAFLDKRKPDFQQFRESRQAELDAYVARQP